MDSLDRAAILLLGIGEENAAEVLKYLEPRIVQRVGATMTNMSSISYEEMDFVIKDFARVSEHQTSFGVDAQKYVKDMLISALGQEKAASYLDRILSNEEENGLNNLRWLDAKTISDLIRNEHPQVIATVLTYLDSEQAAKVISIFPEEKRNDLVLRMSGIDSIKPEALNELGMTIEENLSGKKQSKNEKIGGVKSVADMINYLDSVTETQVLNAIKVADEALCDTIKELMFVFQNFVDVDDRSMQAILKEVPQDVLLIALKGADSQVKEKIFSNMSKRAAELLKDDLDAKGPVKVSEVQAAQTEILGIARRLSEEGDVTLGNKAGEEMI